MRAQRRAAKPWPQGGVGAAFCGRTVELRATERADIAKAVMCPRVPDSYSSSATGTARGELGMEATEVVGGEPTRTKRAVGEAP